MILFKQPNDITNFIVNKSIERNSIGFVPTMGALHNGHISLIQTARAGNKLVIGSIFVNPTQFTEQSDFEKYPSSIEADIFKLEKAGCDVLFLPSVGDMYPNGSSPTRQYDLGLLDTILEGEFRPVHFQGVCQVVHRLLEIIAPGKLYLGQKDFQQCLVLKKMISLLDIDTSVIICPTQREPDGLAMSSRNSRLTPTEKDNASYLNRALQSIKENLREGDLGQLQRNAQEILTKQGFKVEYVAIANALTLEIIQNWDGKTELVALVAAYSNEVRLIDNLLLHPPLQ
jgi:pantoate--beta-alanine ligase